MANQPTPIRPWFRLGSIRAPPPAPAPTAQPRPVLQTRPTFRGVAPTMQPPQPTQPSELPQSQAPPSSYPAPPPTSSPTAADPSAVAPPHSAAGPTVSTPSNVTSVPSSPVAKTSAPSASLQTSPVKNEASPPRAVLRAPTVSSVPSSPEIKASAPSSPVPKSPIPRPSTTNVTSAPSPPVAKVSGSSPASPIKKAASPPPAVLPATIVSSVPSSPQDKASAPLSSAQNSIPRAFSPSNFFPTSRAQNAAQATQNSVNSASPKTTRPAVKTPPQSPKVKVTAPPPSPLALPPSQLKPREETVPKIPVEAEQKTVLVQKTIEKSKSMYNGDGRDLMGNSGEVQKSAILHNGKTVPDGVTRIITLAGENKGAVMDLIQSPKKRGFGSSPKNVHENGNSVMRTVGGHWEYHGNSSSNEDENVKRKDESREDKTKASPPLTAYMNSNVQGINNSIIYGAKCKHNSPGVHLNLSKKPFSK